MALGYEPSAGTHRRSGRILIEGRRPAGSGNRAPSSSPRAISMLQRFLTPTWMCTTLILSSRSRSSICLDMRGNAATEQRG